MKSSFGVDSSANRVVALVLSVGSLLLGAPALLAQSFPVSSSLPAEARQFDFWVGEWDVNVLVRQADFSWKDTHTSRAHIFPILRGKAILELWSEDQQEGIKGYSLRYFDTARKEWVLWLNWPSKNASGSSSLAGTFRHGRGEFFSTRKAPDGSETLSRFTFSDVTPTSLRWDDAFSNDGGNTWRNNWIMEFSRTAEKPTLAAGQNTAHTFHDGSRCDLPQFRRYEFLAGTKTGAVEAGGSGPVTIRGLQVLDGCAVITFSGASDDPETAWGFSQVTWNTYAQRFELMTLTSQPDTPARMFYSQGDGELVFYEAGAGSGPRDRFRIEETTDGSVVWAHETPDGDGWKAVWQARVGG